MGKPYSDLEKQCIAILANGGNPASSQDEAVAKYWQWKTNPSSNLHKFIGDRAPSKRPNGRKLNVKYVKPFDSIVAATTYALITVSARAETSIPTAVKNTLGFQILASGDQGIEVKRYRPAKVYYRTGASENSADRISRITGRTYKSRYTGTDEGYSAPFGVVSTDTEAERQIAIAGAIKTAFPGINTIAFTPQSYRKRLV